MLNLDRVFYPEKSPVLGLLQSLRHLAVTSRPEQKEEHWIKLTALTEMRLWCSDDQLPLHCTIPAGLASLVGLHKLTVRCRSRQDLPAGPYVSHLESLRIVSFTSQGTVPVSLAAAAQLRHLRFHRGTVALTASDIAVISSLPSLKTLGMSVAGFVGEEKLYGICLLQSCGQYVPCSVMWRLLCATYLPQRRTDSFLARIKGRQLHNWE